MSEYIHPYSLALFSRHGADRLAYRDYLQQKSFVKDITKSTVEVQYAISKSSREMIATNEQLQERGFELLASIDSGISRVGQTMENGFESLSYELADISGGIKSLIAKCDWGFSQMIAGIGRVNDSLQELLSVAKTPAQTWAYNQFEIGRDAIRRELYPEAVEAILRATNGFGDHTGYKLEYRFHYTLGILYLGNVKNTDPAILDLGKAEQAFLAAARYAKANFPMEAGVAFIAAGWAAYCQARLPEAVEHTRQALQMDPQSAEAFYQLAKVQMCMGSPSEANPNLRKAIEFDRNYTLKAAADLDFLKHEIAMQSLLEEMRKERALEAEEAIEQARRGLAVMYSWKGLQDFPNEASHAKKLFDDAVANLETRTYFGYLEAITLGWKAEAAANAVVGEQMRRLPAKVKELISWIQKDRNRISAAAQHFSCSKWQEAEDAFAQARQQISSGLSHEGLLRDLELLKKVNQLYLDAEESALRKIQSSTSSEIGFGRTIGGILGGVLGSLGGGIVGGIVGLIGALIASALADVKGGWPDSVFYFLLWIFILAGTVFGIRIGISTGAVHWRQKFEERVRLLVGR